LGESSRFPLYVGRFIFGTSMMHSGHSFSATLSPRTTKEEIVNSVTLIGNLATDVEVRDVGDDKKVANFLLAIDRPNTEEADFVRITAWNRQAEVCAQFLAKGRRIAVDGRLRSSSWEDADGKRRSAIEVVAKSIEFLSHPARQDGGADMPFEAAVA
jgi:single-strand DNA-binding protein